MLRERVRRLAVELITLFSKYDRCAAVNSGILSAVLSRRRQHSASNTPTCVSSPSIKHVCRRNEYVPSSLDSCMKREPEEGEDASAREKYGIPNSLG